MSGVCAKHGEYVQPGKACRWCEPVPASGLTLWRVPKSPSAPMSAAALQGAMNKMWTEMERRHWEVVNEVHPPAPIIELSALVAPPEAPPTATVTRPSLAYVCAERGHAWAINHDFCPRCGKTGMQIAAEGMIPGEHM